MQELLEKTRKRAEARRLFAVIEPEARQMADYTDLIPAPQLHQVT